MPKEKQRRVTQMGQAASVIARRKNKEEAERTRHVAEALKQALMEHDPSTGETYLQMVSRQVGINTAKKGTLKDLKALAEIWGELTQDINVHADVPVVDLQVIGGDDE